MGGFFYISKRSGFDVQGTLEKGRAQFKSSGLPDPVTLDYDDYVVDYYPKIIGATKSLVRFANGDFLLAVGTFLYDGRIGEPALRHFYNQSDPRAELVRARGHFILILRKNAQTWLLKDLLGSYEVFRSCGDRCITSSFLAATAATPSRTIHTQGVYEYVFNGVSMGNITPFKEVRRLDFYEWMTLGNSSKIIRHATKVCPEELRLPRSDLVERNIAGLTVYARELSELFGDNIQIALSAGYDSRLLLALFRRAGITPKLFVYGDKSSEDVRIAKEIAQAEGIALLHVDKRQLCDVNLENYAAVIERNFHMEDALPWGGIFENGAELIARTQRNKEGALHVNGGGGEVFRNFFYLLNRPISLRDFVWTFYSQLDPRQCTQLFDVRTYEKDIMQKVADLLQTLGPHLSRREVECLYPYFRCRSWFGRENSINNRWGYSLLPFFDFQTVAEALRIPIRQKHFGNFESAMIRKADPALAAYPTGYGHNFEKDAPFRAVLKSLMTYLRPPSVRRYTFRARALLTAPPPRSRLFSPDYLSRATNLEFPYMLNFFKIDRVTSEAQFARICTLEYLFGRHPADLIA